MQTRRRFIRQGSWGLAVAISGPMTCLTSSAIGRRSGPVLLSYETFARLVNTRFRATDLSELQKTELLLTQVVARQPAGAGGECFSVLFRGSARRPLEQGTYRFDHSALGAFAMFIVPQPANQFGCEYEALFNRIP